jgi:hypothetical protein
VYDERGILVRCDGTGEVDSVRARVLTALPPSAAGSG